MIFEGLKSTEGSNDEQKEPWKLNFEKKCAAPMRVETDQSCIHTTVLTVSVKRTVTLAYIVLSVVFNFAWTFCVFPLPRSKR